MLYMWRIIKMIVLIYWCEVLLWGGASGFLIFTVTKWKLWITRCFLMFIYSFLLLFIGLHLLFSKTIWKAPSPLIKSWKKQVHARTHARTHACTHKQTHTCKQHNIQHILKPLIITGHVINYLLWNVFNHFGPRFKQYHTRTMLNFCERSLRVISTLPV